MHFECNDDKVVRESLQNYLQFLQFCSYCRYMKFPQICTRETFREAASDKRKARAAATHHAILQAAETLALTEGRQALTTKRLVAEASVSERTLFNHFENIDAILLTRLGQHLADLVDIESFPTDIPLENLPQACEDFLIQTLKGERSVEALDRFVQLAASFGAPDDIGESVGQEVFATMSTMSWVLCEHIAKIYFSDDDLRVLELALYLQNMLTGMIFGMARYMFENPQLQEDPSKYSSQDLRQSMIWTIAQVSSGRPRFSHAN